MPELTLEELNAALSQAKLSEMSRDRVYLIVFDRRFMPQATVEGVLGALGAMGIKSVAVFTVAGEPVKVFTLEPKKTLDEDISRG